MGQGEALDKETDDPIGGTNLQVITLIVAPTGKYPSAHAIPIGQGRGCEPREGANC